MGKSKSKERAPVPEHESRTCISPVPETSQTLADLEAPLPRPIFAPRVTFVPDPPPAWPELGKTYFDRIVAIGVDPDGLRSRIDKALQEYHGRLGQFAGIIQARREEAAATEQLNRVRRWPVARWAERRERLLVEMHRTTQAGLPGTSVDSSQRIALNKDEMDLLLTQVEETELIQEVEDALRMLPNPVEHVRMSVLELITKFFRDPARRAHEAHAQATMNLEQQEARIAVGGARYPDLDDLIVWLIEALEGTSRESVLGLVENRTKLGSDQSPSGAIVERLLELLEIKRLNPPPRWSLHPYSPDKAYTAEQIRKRYALRIKERRTKR